MDPISVSASILGLLGAATKVSEVLTKFIRRLKDAPRSARRLVTEVDDLKLCFHQLQDYVVSENSSARSRKTMIMLDQLCIILTHCVMVFSELEHALDGLMPRNRISIGSRFKWVSKESTMSNLLQRLQSSKLSLNLCNTCILGNGSVIQSLIFALDSVDVGEAQRSIDALTGVVREVVTSNQDLCRRLGDPSYSTEVKHMSAPSALESIHSTPDDASALTPNRDTWRSDATTVVERNSNPGLSFEQDLRRSRVYTRASAHISRRPDLDVLSLQSSTARSIGSSFFSGLSLADVSNISLISLPVSSRSLSNGQRYKEPLVNAQVSGNLSNDVSFVPWSSGKVLLLGISNAGKSTVLKQLHEIQGSKPTRAESEEARHAILTGLVDTFRCGLLQTIPSGIIGDLQGVLHVLTYASGVLNTSGKEEILREERLPAVLDVICQLWEMDEIRGIMDNLGEILRREPSLSCIANLCVHIRTTGLYKSRVQAKPFEFEIHDVSGSRSGRKLWSYCLSEKLDYIMYVVDLNGYCRNLHEDHDAASSTF
ncbi:MAG: hypothetical protein LQ344_004602 [Seirophora lacunosa]|nr:MAG: hypothetical protein LQ344_004602 [Seirophora lacunosa]